MVHSSLTTANVWRVASERPKSASATKFLTILLCIQTNSQSNTCELCPSPYSYQVHHVLFRCECNDRAYKIQVFYDVLTSIW